VTPTTPRDHAHAYAQLGLRVVPTPTGTKYPRIKAWQEAATTDAAQIDEWWPDGSTDGVSIATGTLSGVFALDVDVKGDKCGDDELAALEAEHGKLPDTWTNLTASGGWHLLFRCPVDFEVRNDAGKRLGTSLDIRGEGGQIVAPPSVGSDGGAYSWEDGLAPWDIECADAPAWLLELLRPPVVEAPTKPKATPSDVGERPGDHFNAQVDANELLSAAGWTYMFTSSQGDAYWCRPGKDPREGASGVVYADGHFANYSTTTGLPVTA
jgi:hypothetical protein